MYDLMYNDIHARSQEMNRFRNHCCCCPAEAGGLPNSPELPVVLVPFAVEGAPNPNALGVVPAGVPPNSDWPAAKGCEACSVVDGVVEAFNESPNLNVANDEFPLAAGVDKTGVAA